MRIGFSVIDLSALDRQRLSYIVAMRDIHQLLDPHWALRQYLGASLAPAPVRLLPLGDNVFLVAAKGGA